MNHNQGVVIPQSQKRDETKGEPGKVYVAIPAQLVAVQYADSRGQMIKEFWYKVGDQYYIPDGSEQFTSRLKAVKEGHAKQADTLLAAHSPSSLTIPVNPVDIVSDQVAASVDV